MLKNSMTPDKLDAFCKQIATEYACSEHKFAKTTFCDTYFLTESCFYRILKESVVRHLVTENIVIKMRQKALENQQLHCKLAGESTLRYYNKLMQQRNTYTISLYEDDLASLRKLAEDFANSPSISKKDFALAHDISTYVLDCLLKKAIIENIIDDETFSNIKKRSLNKHPDITSIHFFDNLEHERNLKKVTL